MRAEISQTVEEIFCLNKFIFGDIFIGNQIYNERSGLMKITREMITSPEMQGMHRESCRRSRKHPFPYNE